MMTPTRSDELLRRMLERRAEVPPPVWLLTSVAQAVREAPQARPGSARAWWLPRRRSERLVLVAAAVALLLAVVLGALVAGGLVNRTPKAPLPAEVVLPSPSADGSPDTSAASPSGTLSSPDPIDTTSPGAAVASAWTLPTGWRFEMECNDDASGCGLSLLDEAGRVQDGWPVFVHGDCGRSDVAVGPEVSAFLVCDRDGRAVVTGLDRRGNALPGWPVRLKGAAAMSTWNDFREAYERNQVAVGPDATVYVAAATKGKGSYAIHALAPDGNERPGWPVALAGGRQGFAVAPNGTIVAWWYEGYEEGIELEARRTVFTEIGQDGGVLPGWPKGSAGAASGPIVGDNGSIFYVSQSGKVWGHDRRGDIINGWPYQLKQPVAPSVRADGTLMFIEDARVVVLDRHGKAVPGWPYRADGAFVGIGCDTGGYDTPLAVVADDGTVYVAPWDGTRSSIVALDTDGGTVSGWPYELRAGWRVAELSLTYNGTIDASVTVYDGCDSGVQATSVRLSPQGASMGDPLPTPLTEVYDAVRLSNLRTSDGSDTFVQGGYIGFLVELRNRSDRAIELPWVEYVHGYAAGALQTWIKPLGDGPPPSCLSKDEDDESDWYPLGGEVVAAPDPLTIQPGGDIEIPLSPFIGCLPPGDYRYRVDHTKLGVDGADAIETVTQDFTILAATPGPTPRPTPNPVPTLGPTPTPTPTPPPGGPTTPSPS